MRRTWWARPGGTAGDRDYDAGALRAVTVEGRVLLAGMYCATDGVKRIDLRDASTGVVLAVDGGDGGEWWREPADHFSTFTWQGGTYILHVTDRSDGYRVLRVRPEGLEPVERTSGDDYVSSMAGTVLDGRPCVLTCDGEEVRFRLLGDGDRVFRVWTTPPGWSCPAVLSTGGRSYAWLHRDVPGEHGRRLWDVVADAPVGPPFLMRGYEWGPWELHGRPVMLFKVGWRDLELWDLGRREPLGPGLGDLRLAALSVGAVHGRPVLAAAVGEELRVWDVGTGRTLGAARLPDRPIATAVGPHVWAIGRGGHVTRLRVPVRRIHPSAVRDRRS